MKRGTGSPIWITRSTCEAHFWARKVASGQLSIEVLCEGQPLLCLIETIGRRNVQIFAVEDQGDEISQGQAPFHSDRQVKILLTYGLEKFFCM